MVVNRKVQPQSIPKMVPVSISAPLKNVFCKVINTNIRKLGLIHYDKINYIEDTLDKFCQIEMEIFVKDHKFYQY